jgi:hypothetical protein
MQRAFAAAFSASLYFTPYRTTTSAAPLTARRIIDGLSGAASVIAVVDISAKVASLCFQYLVAVKDAKADIERLHRKVTDINNVLEKL